jgi:hypothetical protein
MGGDIGYVPDLAAIRDQTTETAPQPDGARRRPHEPRLRPPAGLVRREGGEAATDAASRAFVVDWLAQRPIELFLGGAGPALLLLRLVTYINYAKTGTAWIGRRTLAAYAGHLKPSAPG